MRLKQYLQKELVVLIGLPGSGKSTYIKKHYKNHIVVSNDIIVDKYAEQHDIDYNAAFKTLGLSKIIQSGKQDFTKAIKSNKSIVLDNTNLTKKIRKEYLDQAKGYRKIAVIFKVSDKTLQKRLKQRKGKTIPDDVLKKMQAEYEPPTKSEGYDEIIKV